MQRDLTYMEDILRAAELAYTYVNEISYEEFIEDKKTQDAVIRRFEIMGEASRRVSDTTKKMYEIIPWKILISMRNIMIHEYNEVDLFTIWETARDNLVELINNLEGILGEK